MKSFLVVTNSILYATVLGLLFWAAYQFYFSGYIGVCLDLYQEALMVNQPTAISILLERFQEAMSWCQITALLALIISGAGDIFEWAIFLSMIAYMESILIFCIIGGKNEKSI